MLPPGRVSGSSTNKKKSLHQHINIVPPQIQFNEGWECEQSIELYNVIKQPRQIMFARSIVKARITNAKTSLGKHPAVALTYRSIKPVVYSTAVLIRRAICQIRAQPTGVPGRYAIHGISSSLITYTDVERAFRDPIQQLMLNYIYIAFRLLVCH